MKIDNNAFEVSRQAEHETIENFKKFSVEHDHYDSCYKRIKCLCQRDGTSGVVILTGPTGSGKTHLARRIFAELRKAHSTINDIDSANQNTSIPVIGIRATPPRAHAFDWEDFYVRLLQQLRDVLVERKLSVPQLSLFGSAPIPVAADSIKVRVLRQSVEMGIQKRQTRVLIIDEAHHILMCRDQAMQKFAFEQLKSLTDETGVVLVLVGTYDLLDIRDHSGQLMRRSEIVHLQRYDYKDEKHVVAFKNAFTKLKLAMTIPLKIKPSEEGDLLDLCYRKSSGCIGILFDLLLEAQRRTLESNGKAVTMNLIEISAKSNMAMMTILDEALVGEMRLRDVGEEALREKLLEDIPVISSVAKRSKNTMHQRTKRPGTRNPVRDAVGGL